MQPTYIPVSTLFGAQTRHTVPLFQRPYVWTREEQWEPLWEDITGLLDRFARRSGDESVASHFLGTIVLEQAHNPTGSLPRREVIDGQQRLTTLQLLLKSAEHALETAENEAKTAALAETGAEPNEAVKSLGIARRQIAILTENPAYADEIERYKVWPTNEDRAQFREVLDATAECAPGEHQSRMAAAYRYFRSAFEAYLAEGDVVQRAKSFSAALRDYLKVIVLDLDPSDEPQAIFETLNAHGTPLLPADLMKNWLLWEAARQKVDAVPLYASYWQPFDRAHEYWRARVGTGHAARARVDTFLQNWLTLRTLEVVPAKHLYDRFLRYIRHLKETSGGELDLDPILSEIRHFADLYERIDKPQAQGRFDVFLQRLKALDVVVFHPLLLAIMDELQGDKDQLNRAAQILETFLVRRMICNFQTRGYGALVLRLLERISSRQDHEDIASILEAELIDSGDGAAEFSCPTDDYMRQVWTSRRFYNSLRRDRVLMILRALEEDAQSEAYLAEPIATFDWSKVQIEHVMPQKWAVHWPLPAHLSADQRDNHVHGIGNLTLVSDKLNPTMSNAPWLPTEVAPKGKRDELAKHSLLRLNHALLEDAPDEWDEDSIAVRSEKLLQRALKIWPLAVS